MRGGGEDQHSLAQPSPADKVVKDQGDLNHKVALDDEVNDAEDKEASMVDEKQVIDLQRMIEEGATSGSDALIKAQWNMIRSRNETCNPATPCKTNPHCWHEGLVAKNCVQVY